MIPQVVFFLGNDLGAIHDSFARHLNTYSLERRNVFSYLIQEKGNEIVLTSKDEKESVLSGTFIDKVDSIYQNIYTVGATSIDESHLSITLVLPPLSSERTNNLAQFFHETIDKLYKLKDYPLTLFCVNLSAQLTSAIGLNLVCEEENEGAKSLSTPKDKINSLLSSVIGTSKENDSTSVAFKNLNYLKSKLDLGGVPAHLILVDNQNVLGKGINLTEKDLSIVLAEFIESLYQHQVEMFNTWKPETFSFGLSLLFYDSHRIKALIYNKLSVYNIHNSRLLDKSISLLSVFNEVQLVYQNIINFNDEKKKELEVKLEKGIPDSFVLQDLKVEVKGEMEKALKEHFLLFLKDDILTLEEKIYILELLLFIKEPPEGHTSKIANLLLLRYHLLKNLLQNSPDVSLPSLGDLVLKKGNATEQFKKAQEYVFDNKHLANLESANNDSDRRLKEIEEAINTTKSKMVGCAYFPYKLFNTRQHRINQSKIRGLAIEKETISANKYSLTTSTSTTLIFNLTFDLFKMIKSYLSDLYTLRDKIQNEWDTCHCNITQIVDYVYHPLFIHTHKWTDIANVIDINSSYDTKTNSKIALGSYEFLEKRRQDIEEKQRMLWQKQFALFDVTKELEEEVEKVNIPSSIQSSSNSLLIANIPPFIHLKGESAVGRKRSRYLFVNILSKDMNMRGGELKKSLNKFVDPSPTTLAYTNPYKIVSIEINNIINLKECTSFGGENNA